MDCRIEKTPTSEGIVNVLIPSIYGNADIVVHEERGWWKFITRLRHSRLSSGVVYGE